MDISQLLRTHSPLILANATNALSRAHLKSYERVGTETTRLRLKGLYGHLRRCIDTENGSPLIQYVQDIACDRFHHGVELFEVQTAFNVLEETIWEEMRTTMTPGEFMESVGLLSTILGLGKDLLARKYVSLASARHVPVLDVELLAKGNEAALPVE